MDNALVPAGTLVATVTGSAEHEEVTLTEFALRHNLHLVRKATGTKTVSYKRPYGGTFTDTKKLFALTVQRHQHSCANLDPRLLRKHEDLTYYGFRPIAQFTMDYSQGSLVTDKPGIEAALDCAISDATSYLDNPDFFDFAHECDFDLNDRDEYAKAQAAHNGCRQVLQDLRTMFTAAELDELFYSTERL